MKRFFFTMVMGTFLLGLIFTGALTAQESEAAEFTAKYPHVLLPDTPAGRAAERFAKLINERTNGRVEIKVFPNGQLGTNTQIIEQLQMNIVQIAMPPTAILGQFEPRMQLIDLPYIFPTREACYAVLDGEAGKTLLTGLSKVGINGLGFWESGFKQFTTAEKPIDKPSDFKGMKIRTMDSPLIISQYRAWGANPIPIPYAETYNALQQGVADGQENPLVSIEKMKFYEVQDYITVSNHAYLGYAFCVNKEFWDKLPSDIADIFKQTADEVKNWLRVESAKTDIEVIERMKKKGTKVHYLSDGGVKAFVEASRPVHAKYEKTIGKDLLSNAQRTATKYIKE